MLTWKSTGKSRVRLCVLGFQDPASTDVPPCSAILSSQAEALILQCVASKKWKLVSGNSKTAFLSGHKEYHNIFILPPDDVRDILSVSPGSALSFRKAVYGLVNGHEEMESRLKRSFLNHGFTSCALDPCAFVLVKQHNVRCVTGVHVDDLLGRGDEMFDRQVWMMANHEIMVDMEHPNRSCNRPKSWKQKK